MVFNRVCIILALLLVLFIPATSFESGLTGGGGGGCTLATTVTNESSVDIEPSVGTSSNCARADHTHGSRGNPNTFAGFFAEFMAPGDNGIWSHSPINSGGFDIVSLSGRPGITVFKSSGTANSGRIFGTGSQAIYIEGSEETEMIFYVPSLLFSTDIIRFGFMNIMDVAVPTDGVYIDINAGVLHGNTVNIGTSSQTSTSYTISSNTWYRVVIELNSTATLVTFELFNSPGTTPIWTDTLATNIPINRKTGHGVIGYSTSTTADNVLWVDWFDLDYENRTWNRR